jgi:hypothetical protein
VAAAGGDADLLPPPVVGVLLELLLLTCGSPALGVRSRQQSDSLQAQAAALEAGTLGLQAAELADGISAHLKCRVAFAAMSKVVAFSTDLLAQLAAAVESGAAAADSVADAQPIVQATQRQHQAAAAARMPADALLGPMLQIGPALLHLARRWQCSMDAAAAAAHSAQCTSVVQSMMLNYGGVISQLASAQEEQIGDA